MNKSLGKPDATTRTDSNETGHARYRVETSGNVTSNTHSIFDEQLQGWIDIGQTASWPELEARAIAEILNQRDRLREQVKTLRAALKRSTAHIRLNLGQELYPQNIESNALDIARCNEVAIKNVEENQ